RNVSGDGVREVRSITLPTNAIGGTWQIGDNEVDWDDTLDGATMTDEDGATFVVSGDDGDYTLTWTDFGPHSVGVDLSGLEYPSGYVHDNGSWTNGYTHDVGSWTNGYTHDVGYWTNGY